MNSRAATASQPAPVSRRYLHGGEVQLQEFGEHLQLGRRVVDQVALVPHQDGRQGDAEGVVDDFLAVLVEGRLGHRLRALEARPVAVQVDLALRELLEDRLDVLRTARDH